MFKNITRTSWVMIAGAIIFFMSTSALYLFGAPVFNSPDEAASYAVIKSFARNGELWLPAIHADTQATSNLVHPRSMRVIGDRLVPSGFMGLPFIYGVIAWTLPFRAVPFLLAVLTPLIATIALVLFNQIVLCLFDDKRIAWWSTVFLALHPAWWYYTARGLFPNVLFVSLLIASTWLLLRHRKSLAEDVATIAFFCAALFVRPSEFWWVVTLGSALVWWSKKEINFRWGMAWIVSGIFFAIGAFVVYYYVYGAGPLSAISGAYANSTQGFALGAWWRWFLPFGFHPRVIWWSVSHWYDLFLLPQAILTILGIIMVWRSGGRIMRRWVVVYLAVTAWLFLVYGSWLIFDNPSHDVTIGGAYLRYWLPSFVLSAPLAGFALSKIMQKFNKKIALVVGGVIVAGLVGFLVYRAVFGTDGVKDVARAMDVGATLRTALKTHDLGIPDNAIILTDREDKYLSPTWQVIGPVKNHDNLQAVYDLLNEGKPVYFVTPARTILEWRDLKDNWFNPAHLVYTYWFSVGDIEVHAMRRITK